MRQHVFQQCLELAGLHRLVVVPPDGIFGKGITDDKLVERGTTGMLSGFDDQRPTRGNACFAIANRMFV